MSPLYFVMNRSRYDALSPALRGAVDAVSGSELAGRFGAWWEAWADPARDAARRRGNTIHALDGDERRRWARAAEPAVDRWLRGLEVHGVAGAREIYAATRTAADGWRE